MSLKSKLIGRSACDKFGTSNLPELAFDPNDSGRTYRKVCKSIGNLFLGFCIYMIYLWRHDSIKINLLVISIKQI